MPGSSTQWGVCPGSVCLVMCLPRGVCNQGDLPGGVCLGVSDQRGSAPWETPTESQTGVKNYLSTTTVVDGNHQELESLRFSCLKDFNTCDVIPDKNKDMTLKNLFVLELTIIKLEAQWRIQRWGRSRRAPYPYGPKFS